jgi:amino acid transporter
MFAFLGIESALVPSGEVRDTERTVPRAIAIAMTGVTLLYVAILLVAQGILGPTLASMADQGPRPLAEAAAIAIGPWGRTLVLVGAVISMFGYVSGMTLAIPRALYAFGRDGILPAPLARIHPRYRTPHVAIVTQAAVMCALAITGSFAQLAVVAIAAVLLVYLACVVAAWALRRRGVADVEARPFSLPGGWLVHALAAAVIVWLLTSITPREWAVVLAVLAAASLLFFVARGGRRRALESAQQA